MEAEPNARDSHEQAGDAENAPLVFLNRVARGKPENIRHQDGYCPFCDRASLTDVLRQDGECLWLVNKYRTLEDTMQTVLIESERHDGDPSNYGREENRHVFRFALECWGEMLRSGSYESVLMYKNYGPYSGGTLRHPHLQIVGLSHKDGYERVPANAFEGVDVVRDGARSVCLSTHPVMGFVEVNVTVPESEGPLLAAGDDADWLADATQATIRYLLESYHGKGCTSYNLFFYLVPSDVDGTGATRPGGSVVCKVVPRWVTSPYFVGYRISQVDCAETLEAVAADLAPLVRAATGHDEDDEARDAASDGEKLPS